MSFHVGAVCGGGEALSAEEANQLQLAVNPTLVTVRGKLHHVKLLGAPGALRAGWGFNCHYLAQNNTQKLIKFWYLLCETEVVNVF